MGTNKILPYKDATYDTYNCQRNLNSIIVSDNEENIAWFYNAFIQVYSIKDTSYGAMTYNYNIDIAHPTTIYDRCPLVECYSIPNEIADMKYDNISQLCIDLIDNDYYVNFTIDRYYMSNNVIGRPNTFFHDVIVYGYDETRRELLTSDFYGYKATSEWKPFEKVNMAYSGGKNFVGFINGIVVVRNTKKFNWQFSIENYKENLKAYINCTPIVLYHYKYEKDMQYGYSDSCHYYYGFDTYKTFYSLLEDPEKLLSMNYNAFHLFMKHKLLLLNSLKFIQSKGYFADKNGIERILTDNYNSSTQILNMVIKYHTTKQNGILARVKILFETIEKHEASAIKTLIDELCKYDNLYLIKNSDSDNWYFNKKDRLNKEIVKSDEYIKRVFRGSGFKLYSDKGEEYGDLRVNVDGGNEKVIRLYDIKSSKNNFIYSVEGLSDENHIINIYPVENSLINVSRIDIDSIDTETACDSIFQFIGYDNRTKGNWHTQYGKIGYDIFYGRPVLPDNIKVLYKFYGDWDYHEIFEAEDDNQSAIMLPDQAKRIIPLMDSEFAIYIDIAVTGAYPVDVSFYFLNFTGTAKKQDIKVLDLNSGDEVYSFTLENYFDGIYYTFTMKGLYRICLENGARNIGTKTTSPINGVFFDPRVSGEYKNLAL